MKEEFEANSCRVCLTKTKKLRSLYKAMDEEDEPPNEMLQKLTGIQVEKLDENTMLPKYICKNCELSLSMAFEFRENALKTEQMIVSYLNELNVSEVTKETNQDMDKTKLQLKTEFEMDSIDIESMESLDDKLDCNLQNEDREDEQSVPEEEEDKKIIDNEEDDLPQDEAYANVSLNETQQYAEKDTKLMLDDNEDHDSSYEVNENYSDHDDDNKEEINDQEERFDDEHKEEEVEGEDQADQAEMELEEPEDIKQEQEDINIKINKKTSKKQLLNIKKQEQHIEFPLKPENFKQIPRRGRKPINSSNNLGHICDVCGNVYAKRSRMMEHRQRHDKVSKYTCELCNEKFHMRELLRKHMYSHSGGKPLKCNFCSRTFYYESVRKAHEEVHQGLKPHVCGVCGKAFGYAHALKKHTLIHAEIKLYRCEYCNKDFRLQHHMKQHEMTRSHQNVVRVAKSGGIPGVNYGGADDNNDADEENAADDNILVEEITDETYYGS